MATRRQLLIAGAGAAALVGTVQLAPRLVARLTGPDFAPWPPMPGFRTIEGGGAVSGGGAADVLAGIEPRETIPEEVAEAVRADPCAALFPGEMPEGAVPAAYFTDHYCPYCRVLSDLLADVAPEAGLALSHHFTPVFGRASELAARAVLAGRAQGGFAALNDRLMATAIRVTPRSLARIAAEAGLDPDRLARDMADPRIDRALVRSRALARLFGFPGTPALVVNRTVIVGRVEAATLRAVIAAERGAPLPC